MAENEGQERSEQASERKLQKARERGEVAKSRDLTSVMGLAALAVVFFLFGDGLMRRSEELFIHYLGTGALMTLDTESVAVLGREAMFNFLAVTLPPAVAAMVVATLAHMVQVGFLFSAEPITPKYEKIDPIAGMRRLLSLQSVAETLKGILKIVVLGYIMKWVLMGRLEKMADIPFLSTSDVARLAFDTVWAIVLSGLLAYLFFAILDYGFQHWDFMRRQKMSRQELKEEHKEQEGDPFIRARVRSIQREMARRRMMAEVPKATVVITNPTHIAVALKYVAGMNAPQVVAKGKGFIAQKIREIARENNVPVLENKPLARALHRLNLGDDISEDLYKAVAEVLAYVFRRNRRAFQASGMSEPQNVQTPTQIRHPGPQTRGAEAPRTAGLKG